VLAHKAPPPPPARRAPPPPPHPAGRDGGGGLRERWKGRLEGAARTKLRIGLLHKSYNPTEKI